MEMTLAGRDERGITGKEQDVNKDEKRQFVCLECMAKVEVSDDVIRGGWSHITEGPKCRSVVILDIIQLAMPDKKWLKEFGIFC